jgi:hypothetical protein
VVVSGWTPIGRWDLGAADVRSAGPGSGGSGVAGAIADWLAGLLGL